MKKTITFCSVGFAVASICMAAPHIDPASVTMHQDSATRKVLVSYELQGEPAIVTVDFELKNDNAEWKSLGDKVKHVVGDVNRKVGVGKHSLTWIARKDWPNQEIADERVRAVVTAWATNCPPNYMVLDLETNAQLFYPTAEALPYGLSNAIYRTSKLVMRKIPAAGATWVMGQPTNNSVEVTLCKWSEPPDERPHWVSFSSDYYMAIYPMTQGQNKKLTGNDSSKDHHPEKPVDGISYKALRGGAPDVDWPTTDSSVVGGALATMRSKTGIMFDIPTEAEWEFACRAGTQTAFYMGVDATATSDNCGVTDLGEYAWFKGNCEREAVKDGGAYMNGLQIVGQKKPNAWGLYDMMGNVTEWCRDWAGSYDLSVQPILDPTGPISGTSRIKRGGHWGSIGAYCRSSTRRSSQYLDWSLDRSSGGDYWSNGFRLVCPASAK